MTKWVLAFPPLAPWGGAPAAGRGFHPTPATLVDPKSWFAGSGKGCPFVSIEECAFGRANSRPQTLQRPKEKDRVYLRPNAHIKFFVIVGFSATNVEFGM